MMMGGRKGVWPVKKYGGDGGGGYWLVWMEWRPARWSRCLPLLIFPCTIKSRSSLLAPAHPGGPRKRAVKRLWCGVVCGGGKVMMSLTMPRVYSVETDGGCVRWWLQRLRGPMRL